MQTCIRVKHQNRGHTGSHMKITQVVGSIGHLICCVCKWIVSPLKHRGPIKMRNILHTAFKYISLVGMYYISVWISFKLHWLDLIDNKSDWILLMLGAVNELWVKCALMYWGE